MAHNTHNTHESWDVLTLESAAPDSLWIGYLVAQRLAACGRRGVRLFVDDVRRLATLIDGLDPELWIQRHGLFDVYAMALACVLEPAANVVQIHRSPVGGSYTRRLFSGASRRRLVMLHALDSRPDSAVEVLRSDGGLTIHQVVQGGGSDACFVKDARPLAQFRRRLQTLPGHRAKAWESLGVREAPAASALIVLVAGVSPALGSTVIEALARLDVAIHVLQGVGPPWQRREAPSRDERLAVSRLPALTWSQWDDAIGLSNLLITGAESVALRGVQCGCPLAWAPQPASSAAALGDGLSAWYLQHADAAFAPVARKLFRTLQGAADSLVLASLLGQYWLNWSHVEALAAAACESMASAHDAIDVITARAGSRENRHRSSRDKFLATIPVGLRASKAAATRGDLN